MLNQTSIKPKLNNQDQNNVETQEDNIFQVISNKFKKLLSFCIEDEISNGSEIIIGSMQDMKKHNILIKKQKKPSSKFLPDQDQNQNQPINREPLQNHQNEDQHTCNTGSKLSESFNQRSSIRQQLIQSINHQNQQQKQSYSQNIKKSTYFQKNQSQKAFKRQRQKIPDNNLLKPQDPKQVKYTSSTQMTFMESNHLKSLKDQNSLQNQPVQGKKQKSKEKYIKNQPCKNSLKINITKTNSHKKEVIVNGKLTKTQKSRQQEIEMESQFGQTDSNKNSSNYRNSQNSIGRRANNRTLKISGVQFEYSIGDKKNQQQQLKKKKQQNQNIKLKYSAKNNQIEEQNQQQSEEKKQENGKGLNINGADWFEQIPYVYKSFKSQQQSAGPKDSSAFKLNSTDANSYPNICPIQPKNIKRLGNFCSCKRSLCIGYNRCFCHQVGNKCSNQCQCYCNQSIVSASGSSACSLINSNLSSVKSMNFQPPNFDRLRSSE